MEMSQHFLSFTEALEANEHHNLITEVFSWWSLFLAALNLFSPNNKAFYKLIPLKIVSSIWYIFNEQQQLYESLC